MNDYVNFLLAYQKTSKGFIATIKREIKCYDFELYFIEKVAKTSNKPRPQQFFGIHLIVLFALGVILERKLQPLCVSCNYW